MATVIKRSGTGEGVTYNPGNTYIWNGHGFWPPMRDQGFDEGDYAYNTTVLYNADTSFDLTNFRPGYEVVLYLVVIETTSSPNSGNYTMKFEDNSSNVLYTQTSSFNHPADASTSYESFAWIAIGCRPSPYSEINYNGTYYAKTTGAVSETKSFTTSGLNTSLNTLYSSDKGMIWVESTNIVFICQLGTVQSIQHDGSTYGSHSTSEAGKIWVPDGASGLKYLCYIDSSGNERHTKEGTYYFDIYDTSVTSTSSANAGAISVSDSPNWTSIKFVAADGNVVQLGQGYLYGNMY